MKNQKTSMILMLNFCFINGRNPSQRGGVERKTGDVLTTLFRHHRKCQIMLCTRVIQTHRQEDFARTMKDCKTQIKTQWSMRYHRVVMNNLLKGVTQLHNT